MQNSLSCMKQLNKVRINYYGKLTGNLRFLKSLDVINQVSTESKTTNFHKNYPPNSIVFSLRVDHQHNLQDFRQSR
jgi:hypothetical protein